MLTLSIDTALTASITITRDGAILGSAREEAPRRHAEDLGLLVEQAKTEAGFVEPLAAIGVERVVAGRGPGSFTAVRAGLAFATTLAYALDVPGYGLCSLDGFALDALDEHPEAPAVTVITDARRREVFWARYEREGENNVRYLAPPHVGPLSEALDAGRVDLLAVDPMLVGALNKEAAVGGELPESSLFILNDPTSATLARIAGARIAGAQICDGRTAETEPRPDFSMEPIYLRRPDVNVPKPRT